MNKFKAWKTTCAVILFCGATTIALPAQTPTKVTFKTLVNFNRSNGAYPSMTLVQGLDGRLYGTASEGGVGNAFVGTVFKITTGGELTTLHTFCEPGTVCADGAIPNGLVLSSDGNFYGTTVSGGANCVSALGCGTVFKITPDGALTTVYSFCRDFPDCTDGSSPSWGLVQSIDGSLYGTTALGGTSRACTGGCGTVFKITAGGKLTTLHSFDGTDGVDPDGRLFLETDGLFYGTTLNGGTSNSCTGGCGTVFKITAEGRFTTLHNFDLTEGANPVGLVRAADGTFYGTAESGGSNHSCPFQFGCGTVFKIGAKGVFTTLHRFGGADGSSPESPLIQGTDGSLFGTTFSRGIGGYGTVFIMTTGGALTTLHKFDVNSGNRPTAGLVQATNGSFYGVTAWGGSGGVGTVYKLSTDLGPFVETLPPSGKIGATVKVLGTDLTGATSVSFHGTEAKFKVVSKSEITTEVPTGATTGKVEVKTPHGTLVSNVVFRVRK